MWGLFKDPLYPFLLLQVNNLEIVSVHLPLLCLYQRQPLTHNHGSRPHYHPLPENIFHECFPKEKRPLCSFRLFGGLHGRRLTFAPHTCFSVPKGLPVFRVFNDWCLLADGVPKPRQRRRWYDDPKQG